VKIHKLFLLRENIKVSVTCIGKTLKKLMVMPVHYLTYQKERLIRTCQEEYFLRSFYELPDNFKDLRLFVKQK
jgi:hypothetical protein